MRRNRARRPHLEDVLREHGQQRDCAPEENGEEVERDGAQEHARPADQAYAGQHLADIHGAFVHRRRAPCEGETHAEPDQREADPDRVDELGADREQDPADRGPDDERELEADRPLRDRAHEDLLRHERRRERTARSSERASRPVRNASAKNGQTLIGAVHRHDEKRTEDDDVVQ